MRYAQRHSGRSPRLLVALERRIVFTFREAAERAPAFDYWRTLFEEESGHEQAQQAQQQEQQPPQQHSGQEGAVQQPQQQPGGVVAAPAPATHRAAAFPLVGKRLEVAGIPQRLFPYERSPYLELWELRLRPAR